MLIKYNENLDTTIKYSPLEIHFIEANNVLMMKINKQDDRLKINDDLFHVSTSMGDNFYISSALYPEISGTMLYINGSQTLHSDCLVACEFTTIVHLKEYINKIKDIFKNVNIFDTTILVTTIDLKNNMIETNKIL